MWGHLLLITVFVNALCHGMMYVWHVGGVRWPVSDGGFVMFVYNNIGRVCVCM